jgi:hypothetical protein
MPRFANAYGGGGRRSGGGSSGGFLGGMGRSRHGSRKDYDLYFKHVAALYSISTAFLESISKSDKAAELWLAEEANFWLRKTAHLRLK